MRKESTKVADLFEKDINKLCNDINCVIQAHNKLVDENEQLQQRIDKAIEYIKLNIRDIDYDTEEYDYLMNILEGKK